MLMCIMPPEYPGEKPDCERADELLANEPPARVCGHRERTYLLAAFRKENQACTLVGWMRPQLEVVFDLAHKAYGSMPVALPSKQLTEYVKSSKVRRAM
jgi:hypothetical protein